MKILLDLPEETVGALETIAVRLGEPRAEVLRRAVASYVSANTEPISTFFGLWAGNRKTSDVACFVDQVRKEWER